MAQDPPFKLSVQLEGHSADVRSVSALRSADPAQPVLLSGSRDGTARIWGRPSGSRSKRDLVCRHILEGQAGFVNCCAWGEIGGQVLALAGGQDHLVNAYTLPPGDTAGQEPSSLTPEYTLVGHSDNVCALDVLDGPGGYIVSGSWDKTARVWRNFECVATLAGHEQAVWAVLALDEDHVLTASADKLVRLYSISKAAKEGAGSKPIATFTGNTDAARGLVRLNERQFASCGNDGNIHVYPVVDPSSARTSPAIAPLQTLSGHTSFVYSLAALSGHEMASGGEDRSVRIWRQGHLQQTITIPAISVWSVASIPNGDVACASSDGTVRVFTRVQQRLADTDILQAYDGAVSSQSLNKAQVGDVKKDDLPGSEALSEPGNEGQVKMVRNGDLVEAHQYSTASGGWEKIGEVVGGVGSSSKKLHEGKEYDYVFDVDIADGVPPLKLPYNASENPYTAAQRFLEKNELPLTYLDQVVAFIEKNTGAVNIGGSEFVDPYTGASSYRPGNAGPTASPASNAPTKVSAPPPRVLPVQQPLTFKQFNVNGAKAAFKDLMTSIGSTDEESSKFENLLDSLARLASGQVSSVDFKDTQALSSLLAATEYARRIPVLDAYRVACLSNNTDVGEAAHNALQGALRTTPDAHVLAPSEQNGSAVMLALRGCVNALSRGSPRSVATVCQQLENVTAALSANTLNKAARTAYATVLVNMSIVILRSGEPTPLAAQVSRHISLILDAESNAAQNASDLNAEAIYRASVALGNLCVSPSQSLLSEQQRQKALQAARRGAKILAEDRLNVLLREIDSTV